MKSPMMNTTSRLALTLALAVLPVAATACGGSGNGGAAQLSSADDPAPRETIPDAPPPAREAFAPITPDGGKAPPSGLDDPLRDPMTEKPTPDGDRASDGPAAAPNDPETTPAREQDPRVKEAYVVSEWPAAGPRRAGVAFLQIAADGWERSDYQVDPRRGEAKIAFRRTAELPAVEGLSEEEAAEAALLPPTVFVTVRLHDDAAAARQTLLTIVLAVTTVLAPEPELGDVAFGGRAGGTLGFVAAARGNVSFIVRAAADGESVGDLAAATDAAALAAPELGDDEPIPAPKIAGVTADRATVGRASPLALALDPAAPAPAYIAWRCSVAAASVVRGAEGWDLFSGKEGEVVLKGEACSEQLQRASFEGRVTVVKGD